MFITSLLKGSDVYQGSLVLVVTSVVSYRVVAITLKQKIKIRLVML